MGLWPGAFQVAQEPPGKNPPANTGAPRDVGLIPGLERSPGEENGNPFQYSCLENPMDRGPWQATVQGVTKSWTLLSTAQHKGLQPTCIEPLEN